MTEIKYYKAAEALLHNYNMLKISIENAKLEIEEVKNKDIVIKGISYDGIKSSPTFEIKSQTEDITIKNIEYIDLLTKRIEITQNKLSRLDNAIDSLNEIEKQIIKMRYIEGLQWYQIAYKMRYTERWCKQLRTQAVTKMAVGLYGEKAIREHNILRQ